jgi:hypothetical protein
MDINNNYTENIEQENYLVDNPDITLDELYCKYYPIIQKKLTDNNYQVSLVNIQIWKSECKRENIYYGFCEDCNQLAKLHWEDACMDGNDCCLKLICIDECIVYCSKGHLNTYPNYRYNDCIECFKCNETVKIHQIWWGLTPEEHIRRYG